MPKQSISITTLSRGEASPDLAGRADFDAYRKSALRIYNMRPIATGGIARRDGLKFDADAAGARLAIPFEASDGTSHLFLLSPLSIEAVDTGGARRASLASSFGADDIAMVRWAQKGDETHLVCATKPPCRIAYTPHLKAFTISGWEFAKRAGGDFSTRPFARFPATSGVRLRPSAASGTATIEADSPIFAPGHIGSLLSINGGQALVSSVAGNRMSATAQVKHPLSSAGEWTDDWREQAFSTARGWPASITFHQNRMVIGGSRDLPNRIWLSKTAEHDNFDLGDGLDDEAIEFDILSDKGHRISSVFSGKHLLVFTSEGEFMVGGAPMTPTSVSIREQTGIGSPAERNIPPRFVEGSVIFTARNGREVREFVYGEIEGGYESRDLAALSSHLLVRPAWQEYDKAERILYIINEDGTCACLSLNKALDFEAWFQYETDGKFVSAAFAGGKMFFIVERGGACLLEHLDKDATADSCACADTESFALSIGGLGHLEGREVVGNADGRMFSSAIRDGEAALPVLARKICAGLAFSHLFAPMPPFIGRARPPKASRLESLVLRVDKTPLIEVDAGGGTVRMAGQKIDRDGILGYAPPLFCGDIKIFARGFVRGYQTPLYRIVGASPCKVKILNITATIECAK